MRLTLRSITLGLLSTLLVAGCSDAADPGGAITAAPAAAGLSTAPSAQADRLASALARALSRPAARAGLRNALRASPYTDHRLDLSEYLATRAGSDLLDAAAQESGVPRATVEQWVRALPASDIYVPFRAHRMRWRGGEDAKVAVVMDSDETATSLRVFSTDGRPGTLTRDEGVPAYALVVIAPAEYKIKRSRRQAAASGGVIQDPDDGEAGGVFIPTAPDGTPLGDPVALMIDPDECIYPTSTGPGTVTVMAACPIGELPVEPEPTPTPTPTPTGPADTTKVASFIIHEHFEPFWDGSMEIRMEVKHHRYVDPGAVRTTVAQGVLRFSGIHDDETYWVNRVAFFSRVVESGHDGISYWLDEEDVFFGDWIGSRECRQMDGCQANNVPVKIDWKSSDCSGSIPDYNVGCTHRHTATVTSRWTPKYY